jgi:leader peptidase (prepilin peptidase)/N-methyltransferase
MWLGGKCRDCKTPISIRYPLIELTTGLLFLACALYFRTPSEIVKYCSLSFLLLGLIFTDIDHQLLPDAMTLPGTVLGLAFSFLVWVQGIPGWMPKPQSPLHLRFISFFHACVGAAVGAGLIYLVGELYFRLRGREGMGFGDVKLMALIGAFLGMRLALFTIFAASLTGALTGLGAMLMVFLKRRRRYRNSGRAWQSARVLYAGFPIPFGVFLGSMALVAAFFGNFILNWYWNQF